MDIRRLLVIGLTLMLIGTMILSVILSCKHESEGIDQLDPICFETKILPIFQASCALSGCHDSPGEESEYVFTDYTHIMEAITPGDPNSSPAYTSLISASGEEGLMPPGQPLSKQNRTLIRVWIEQGALNENCGQLECDQDTLCTQNPDTTAYSNPRSCFQRDILPVLKSSCAISGCHDAITHRDGYNFTDYANTMSAVLAGNPSESKLYEVITTSEIEDKMPPSPYPSLSSTVIDSIYNWISYGALDEECGEACDTVSTITFAGIVWPIIEQNCRGCHSGTSPGGGILLTNYTQVAAQASNGKLTGVLRDGVYVLMPPSGPLEECKIKQIELWVDAGSLNNK